MSRRGFTLIEMLVTVTIFAVALSALVSGLRTGIRAWRTVRAHLVRETELARTFRLLGEDLRHLAVVSKESRPLTETEQPDGGDTLVLTALSPRNRQRAGLGAVWQRIEYRVVFSEAKETKELLRTCEPHVTETPMRGAKTTETLVTGIVALHADYGSDGEMVPVWDRSDALPGLVSVTIEREKAPPATTAVWLPLGALGGGRVGF